MELAAWIAVMTKPMRIMYATDSASMLGKAVALLKAAKEIEGKEKRGEKTNKHNLSKNIWTSERWRSMGGCMECGVATWIPEPKAPQSKGPRER